MDDRPPLVDASAIIQLVGRPAYDRGSAYARRGAVIDTAWDPESGLLTAAVQGGEPGPYHCSIVITSRPNGRGSLGRTICSCPVQTACKHVAAALLDVNSARVKEIGAHTLGSDGDGGESRDSSEDAASWKHVLSGESSGASHERSPFPPDRASAVPSALGLLFELRARAASDSDRWRGPSAFRQTAGTAAATFRLGVRPVIRGRSGAWTRQGVTWSSLPHQSYRLELDPAQHRWFLEFVALHRATRLTYYPQDGDWLYLDDFASPLLWPLLDRAKTVGIEFVGSKKTEIRLGERADIHLDLSAARRRTGDDDEQSAGEKTAAGANRADGSKRAPAATVPAGDLRVATILDIDGSRLPAAKAGLIGDHGVYAYPADLSITIAPTVTPLSADQRRLVAREPELTIPAQDVGEFMSSYYARLARSVEFTSEDGSVDIPEIVPPTLVLTATFAPKHSLTLDWHFEYSIADHVRDAPVRMNRHDPDRDPAAEQTILARLDAVPGVPIEATTFTGLDAAEFSATVLPSIAVIEGVRIDIVGTQPDYRELTEAPQLTVRTMETDRRDWFDLGVIVTVEGRDVPFQSLFAALSQGKKKIMLADNSYLSLDRPVFDQLRELIEEAGTLAEWQTGPRISRYQASLWSDFEDLADESEQAVTWRATAAGLMDAVLEPTPLPSNLQAELRPYQKDGFDWLAFLWRHGLGGILADDMGLGKTLQSLALIAYSIETTAAASSPEVQPSGSGISSVPVVTASTTLPSEADINPPPKPFLVVAPTSVVSNWVGEAARFVPSLTVHGVTATENKSGVSVAHTAQKADIVVTSYALLRLDFEAYQQVDWAGALFDEAQFLKNPASRANTCAVELRAPFKLALTGTPIENSLTDLWALFAVVAPGLFPSLRRFTEQYVRPVGRGSSAQNRKRAGKVGVSGSAADDSADAYSRMLITRLRRRIRPLMMRRTKDVVARDLPARQEQELRIDLAPRHRKLYDTVLQRERQKLLGLIEDLDRNRFIVFRSLTLLRMLSLDATLIDEKYANIPSSKLDALEEQLEDVVSEGHRALIFSQFTSFLKLAADRLEKLGIEYAYLDGSTARRPEVIDGFRNGTAPVFLISLKAGGFGLNLTEADYVFLLDPWWNPAVEAQAVDRTHRFGQTRNVMVYRLVASGTIEEKVMALKAQKAALFDAVMDDDAVFSSSLTADDIRGLLEP